MSNEPYGAQCMMCSHAKRRGRMPVSCERFPETEATEEQHVLNGILYRLAGTGRCSAFSRLVMHKDAYFAEDLPDDGNRWNSLLDGGPHGY